MFLDAEKQIESDFNNALQKMTASKARDNYTNKTELSINGLKGLIARYYLYKKILQKVKSLVDDIVGSGNYKDCRSRCCC